MGIQILESDKARFPILYILREMISTLKPSPRNRNAKRQNGCLRRPYKQLRKKEAKGKGEKERYTHMSAEFQTIARTDMKTSLSDQYKEIGENSRMGKTIEISSGKSEIPRKHFMQRYKYRTENGMDLTGATKKKW